MKNPHTQHLSLTQKAYFSKWMIRLPYGLCCGEQTVIDFVFTAPKPQNSHPKPPAFIHATHCTYAIHTLTHTHQTQQKEHKRMSPFWGHEGGNQASNCCPTCSPELTGQNFGEAAGRTTMSDERRFSPGRENKRTK